MTKTTKSSLIATMLITALGAGGCGNFGANVPFGGGCIDPVGSLLIMTANELRTCDIDTLELVASFTPPAGTLLSGFGGFDDGRHMVAEGSGNRRIFLTDHSGNPDVLDFCSAPLTRMSPSWGVNLSEGLGLAIMPNGKIIATDEEDELYRLTNALALDRDRTGGSFDGSEGVAYDPVRDRVYVADEDDGDIEIFNGSTLDHIDYVSSITGWEGPYWLGVDASAARLFELSEDCAGAFPNQRCGIQVYNIIAGGDDLAFDQTLVGSSGPTTDCYGTLAVSDAHDRMFAIDYCNDTVVVFDTTTLAQIGTVPSACVGADAPTMVAVTD